MVDTAAEGGLVGTIAFERLQEYLRSFGLCCKWIPKNTAAKGVGGQAKVVGVTLIPLGIGGVNGILEATVVEGDVPLLLPIRMMKGLRTIIDLDRMKFTMNEYRVTVDMHELPSGHVTVDITQFENGKFQMPSDVPGCQDSDFRMDMKNGNTSCTTVAMVAQFENLRNRDNQSHLVCDSEHGGAAEKGPSTRKWTRTAGCADGGCKVGGAQPEEGNPWLESDHGQDMHHPPVLHVPKHRGRLVSSIAALASLTARGIQGGSIYRGHLCGDHSECPSFTPFEVTSVEAEHFSFQLHPPEEQVEGWRKCSGILHSVQGVSQPVGEHLPVIGDSSRTEGAEGGNYEGSLESKRGNGGRGLEERRTCPGAGGFRCEDGPTSSDGGHRGKEDAKVNARESEEGGRAAEDCNARGREEARSIDQEPDGEERERLTRSDEDPGECSRELISREATGCEMQVRREGREVDSPEGRAQEGHEVLQVHDEGLRLLRVGEEGGSHQQQRKLHHGGRSVRAFEESKEPTPNSTTGCGGDRQRWTVMNEKQGSWCYATDTRARRVLRRLQGECMRKKGTGLVQACSQFQMEENSGEWKDREGLVPLRCEEAVRVWLEMTHKGQLEEVFGEDQWKGFKSKERKKVNQAFEMLLGQEGMRPVVSEVFSPPRVAKKAEEMGMTAGSSFDYETGWDLGREDHKRKMWKQLKQEEPELVILCPPCKAFTILQELNFGKMDLKKAITLVSCGLDNLQLAMEIAKWQWKRGKYFLFEHPDTARSWNEECVEEVKKLEEVDRGRCDMCAHGMAVTPEGYNRKPTGIMSNSRMILKEVCLECPGGHPHVALIGGLAHKAQRYPEKFCQAVIRGLRRQLRQDGGWSRRVEGETDETYVFAEEEEGEGLDLGLDEEEVPMVGEKAEEIVGEQEGGLRISQQEERAVHKLHKGLGHPATGDLVRFMKAARVKEEIVRWTAKRFVCNQCESRPRPRTTRPATIPKAYQPNKVVGIDLIYIPTVGGSSLIPALSIVDYGSNYQMVQMIENKEPENVWRALWTSWVRTFGLPEVITCDAGKEFASQFVQKATAHGVVVYQIGARAPWQNGRAERHGAHFKELLEKARSEMVVTSMEELRLLMQEVEAAKNRFSNRSGFSPVQRQIGQWPRCPSEILSDDVIDPTLVSGALVDDLERLHEMRRIAQKVFIEKNTRQAVQKGMRGRARTSVEFKAGDYVYVYRVYRLRKRKAGEYHHIDHARNKPTWVGPGTVVTVDGANLWITVWGELWKVAREQCRLATNAEKEGIELVLSECVELIDEYKKTSRRAGYKDLTEEPWPNEEEAEGEPEENRGAKRKVQFEDAEDELYIPTSPEEAEDGRGEDFERRASRESARTREEPEEEEDVPETVRGSNSSPSLGSILEEPVESLVPSQAQMQSPEFQQSFREATQAADRLDGVPHGAWREDRSGERAGPYLTEVLMIENTEDFELEELDESRARANYLMKQVEVKKKRSDYWEVDPDQGTLIRRHVRKRRARFNPSDCRDLPVRLEELKEERRTQMEYVDNRPAEGEEDQWTVSGSRRKSSAEWKGSTVFFFKRQEEEEVKEARRVLMAEKKRNDEVNMKKESPRDLEEWRIADKAEWDKIAESGAVQVLSLEESRKVVTELRKNGKEKRVLPTKIARRYKPSEQPGVPASKKSRLCLRGDLDPDILSLERFSPTVNTMNLAVMLQLAANENMLAQIGDLKNAFCQSSPLERKEGPLYFKQPSEGIDGLHPEQVVRIIAGCYGLVDAPLHWRKSLTEELRKLGYVQSHLDPCLYKLYQDGKLEGMIAIEVDDLFMVGHQVHLQKLEKLKKRFVFGKFVTLKECPEGAMFNGRRIKQLEDGEFCIDMQKFVEERLFEVSLEKGRASQKKDKATEKEKSMARATCGALNWLSKEGRPDAAGPSSLMSARLCDLKIEDIQAMNEVVRNLKKNPGLAVRIQPLQGMRLSVVSDASFGNDNMHSQGGQMIVSHESGLQENQEVRANLLWWRSGRIHRVVNSTLAAETQSLSRGLGDLLWILVLIEELKQEEFSIREWPSRLSGKEVTAIASKSSSEGLRESLAIVDAKSLYDHLCKETIGGQDKRTAIEIQIIREDLNSLSGKIRWVDHPAMIADGLTKVKGSNESLYRMMRSGNFKLVAESDHMEARNVAKVQGQSVNDIRRFGINKNVGSCEKMDMFKEHLIPNLDQ